MASPKKALSCSKGVRGTVFICCLLGIAGLFSLPLISERSLTTGSSLPLTLRGMGHTKAERISSPVWRHPFGRNLWNGSLIAENTSEQRIRLYSAFFDDRERSAPRVPFVIRVIATAIEEHTRGDTPFRCVLVCAENTSAHEVIILDRRENGTFAQLHTIKK